MSKITLLLEMLGDGKWREIGAVQERIKLSDKQLHAAIAFLSKYDLVETDSAKEKIKISKNFQKFCIKTST